jgi:hypothetical protein
MKSTNHKGAAMNTTTPTHRNHDEARAEVPAEFRVVGYKTETGLVCRGHNASVSQEPVTATQIAEQAANVCAILGASSVSYGCEVCGIDLGSL